jgi:hypothetical protein
VGLVASEILYPDPVTHVELSNSWLYDAVKRP